MDAGSTPAYSTIPCFDEHLSIKVYKTHIYLICGFRNPFEEESEKRQNSYPLSIGGVRKWVKRSYGLEISKSSVCSVRDKCGADKLEVGAAKIVPKLKILSLDCDGSQVFLAAFRDGRQNTSIKHRCFLICIVILLNAHCSYLFGIA